MFNINSRLWDNSSTNSNPDDPEALPSDDDLSISQNTSNLNNSEKKKVQRPFNEKSFSERCASSKIFSQRVGQSKKQKIEVGYLSKKDSAENSKLLKSFTTQDGTDNESSSKSEFDEEESDTPRPDNVLEPVRLSM